MSLTHSASTGQNFASNFTKPAASQLQSRREKINQGLSTTTSLGGGRMLVKKCYVLEIQEEWIEYAEPDLNTVNLANGNGIKKEDSMSLTPYSQALSSMPTMPSGGCEQESLAAISGIQASSLPFQPNGSSVFNGIVPATYPYGIMSNAGADFAFPTSGAKGLINNQTMMQTTDGKQGFCHTPNWFDGTCAAASTEGDYYDWTKAPLNMVSLYQDRQPSDAQGLSDNFRNLFGSIGPEIHKTAKQSYPDPTSLQQDAGGPYWMFGAKVDLAPYLGDRQMNSNMPPMPQDNAVSQKLDVQPNFGSQEGPTYINSAESVESAMNYLAPVPGQMTTTESPRENAL